MSAAVAEATVQRNVWAALGIVSRLFRVNTGKGWVSGIGKVERLANGAVVVHAARPVALGFGMTDGSPLKGAADLNGWTTVTITPEMVGRKVAVFTAIETKKSKGGKVSDDQRNYISQVLRAGGIAGVATSSAEALNIIEQFHSQSL